MGKKALFFDIDGTLIPFRQRFLPEDTLQALVTAQEKGHLVFINTGRVWSALQEKIRQLPVSGFLCGCGTSIHYKDEILLHYTIPQPRCNEIVSMIFANGASIILEAEEDVYPPRSDPRYPDMDFLRSFYASFGRGLQGDANDLDHPCDKFCFLADPETRLDVILSNLAPDMDVIPRNEKMNSRLYEVVPKGYSKATAVRFVMEHFGVALEDTYSFGDSGNDLAMFQACCHNTAMKVHDPVLDAYTEFVTEKAECGGITLAMKHFGLI